MKKKTIIIALLILGLAIIGFFQFQSEKDINQEETNNNDELSVVSSLLDQLPYETTIAGKDIVFDQQSIEPKERSEYAQLPYEVEIGEKTRLTESNAPMTAQTPIEFTETFIENNIPPEEELDMYSEGMYEYKVSFYEMNEDEAGQYPASDHPEAGNAEEGVSVYIQAMNFPDDSIGGNENRFDLIVSENDSWIMVWHGESNFCRRPDNQFWQPADQLCP